MLLVVLLLFVVGIEAECPFELPSTVSQSNLDTITRYASDMFEKNNSEDSVLDAAVYCLKDSTPSDTTCGVSTPASTSDLKTLVFLGNASCITQMPVGLPNDTAFLSFSYLKCWSSGASLQRLVVARFEVSSLWVSKDAMVLNIDYLNVHTDVDPSSVISFQYMELIPYLQQIIVDDTSSVLEISKQRSATSAALYQSLLQKNAHTVSQFYVTSSLSGASCDDCEKWIQQASQRHRNDAINIELWKEQQVDVTVLHADAVVEYNEDELNQLIGALASITSKTLVVIHHGIIDTSTSTATKTTNVKKALGCALDGGDAFRTALIKLSSSNLLWKESKALYSDRCSGLLIAIKKQPHKESQQAPTIPKNLPQESKNANDNDDEGTRILWNVTRIIITHIDMPMMEDFLLPLEKTLLLMGMPTIRENIKMKMMPGASVNLTAGDMIVVVGQSYLAIPSHRFIVFNIEQMESEHFNHANLQQAVRQACAIWDFSTLNIAYWKSIGFTKVFLMPFSIFMNELILPPHLNATTDIELPREPKALFFGSDCARRLVILDIFHENKVPIITQTRWNLWGEARNKFVDSAELAVNLHCYPAASLETLRIVYLLGRSKCVVSEVSTDPQIDDVFRDCVIFVPRVEESAGDIPDAVLKTMELLNNQEELQRCQERALPCLRRLKISAYDVLRKMF